MMEGDYMAIVPVRRRGVRECDGEFKVPREACRERSMPERWLISRRGEPDARRAQPSDDELSLRCRVTDQAVRGPRCLLAVVMNRPTGHPAPRCARAKSESAGPFDFAQGFPSLGGTGRQTRAAQRQRASKVSSGVNPLA